MSLVVHIGNQLPHSSGVVRHHRAGSIEYIIDGYRRNTGHQLRHRRIPEVYVGNHHAVAIAVAAVIQVAHGGGAQVFADKGDIIASGLHAVLQCVQYAGKELVSQAAVHLVFKEDTNAVTAIGLQRPGNGIGVITQFLGPLANSLGCFLAHIRGIVQCLADRSRGHPTGGGHISQGWHSYRLFQIVCFEIVFVTMPL